MATSFKIVCLSNRLNGIRRSVSSTFSSMNSCIPLCGPVREEADVHTSWQSAKHHFIAASSCNRFKIAVKSGLPTRKGTLSPWVSLFTDNIQSRLLLLSFELPEKLRSAPSRLLLSWVAEKTQTAPQVQAPNLLARIARKGIFAVEGSFRDSIVRRKVHHPEINRQMSRPDN
eukprot:GHVN01090618.1.p2 GENE.GHVN01090618.1~~GHVN01090618.1.p2  ORF type:complete len:172 (+),score=0.86 GHVN01090618.1:586-1101(+)